MCTSLGLNGSSSVNSAALYLQGAIVTVGNNFTLATQSASAGHNAAISLLQITAGSLTVNGDILCGLGVASPATRTVTLTLDGGTLDLTGHTIGGTGTDARAFVDRLNWLSGTLMNVARINNTNDLVKTGPGLLTLAGANTYSGRTVVSNGTLWVTGTIGTNSVRVTSASVLGGNGVIRGPVTIQPDGLLSPGLNAYGTLTISNLLALQGTTVMEIGRTAFTLATDQVFGISTLTQGGVLEVQEAGYSYLRPGDTFKLFSAQSYGGSFASINLPSWYTWTNRLAIDGTIAVLSSPVSITAPTLNKPVVAGGNLVLTGEGGTPYGGYYLVTSTNLVAPLNTWTILSTNLFTPEGSFSNSIPINLAEPDRFYMILQ
jgi:autotransporter-associated beta strand protein